MLGIIPTQSVLNVYPLHQVLLGHDVFWLALLVQKAFCTRKTPFNLWLQDARLHQPSPAPSVFHVPLPPSNFLGHFSRSSFFFHAACGLSLHLLEQSQMQRIRLPHPNRPLRVIPLILTRIRMHQHRQRTPPDIQPRYKSAELLWREEIDFKHPHWVRAYGLIPDLVDAQFREFVTYTRPQLFGILELRGVGLEEIDVDVEATPRSVGNGCFERRVGAALCLGRWVDEGLAVGGLFTVVEVNGELSIVSLQGQK